MPEWEDFCLWQAAAALRLLWSTARQDNSQSHVYVRDSPGENDKKYFCKGFNIIIYTEIEHKVYTKTCYKG